MSIAFCSCPVSPAQEPQSRGSRGRRTGSDSHLMQTFSLQACLRQICSSFLQVHRQPGGRLQLHVSARSQRVPGQPLPGVRPQQDAGRGQADGVCKLLHDIHGRLNSRSVGRDAKCKQSVLPRARVQCDASAQAKGLVAISLPDLIVLVNGLSHDCQIQSNQGAII